MSDLRDDPQRDAVYRAVREYLQRNDPEQVDKLDRVFGPVYRAAEIRNETPLTETSPEEGEGLPFDGSLVAGTLLSAATWLAFNLVQAWKGRIGIERRAAVERRLQRDAESREMAADLQRLLHDLGTVQELLDDPEVVPEAARLPGTVPDLTIFVRQGVSEGKPTLRYELKAAHRDLDLSYTSFGPVALALPPRALFDELYGDLGTLARRRGSPGRATRQLEGFGTQLAHRLLPGELQERLWHLRDRVQSVLILSDEPWIPWELLALQDPAGDVPTEFLGEAFAVTRWLRGLQETMELSFSEVALVAPGDTALPAVEAEAAFLESLAGPRRSVRRIEPWYEEVTDALGDGRFDAWHFCGHGSSEGLDPDGWPILLQGGDRLAARDLSRVSRGLRERRPLVFLNSCHSGRTAEALAGLGGLAPAFLGTQVGAERKAAAGAFVGAYWSVADDAAHRFAEGFYRELMGGESIGEAARRSRRRLAEEVPGDPARAAYTVFAHPLARL